MFIKTVRRCLLMVSFVSSASVYSDEVATNPADCLLARTPYSVDTPLIDLLLDPRTKALILQAVPRANLSTQVPTPAAIMSLRQFTQVLYAPADKLPELDRELARIPITDEAAVRRCTRYDHTPPELPAPERHPAILVFEKITGFRDAPSVDAARRALAGIAERRGWSITFTDNGAVFNATQLKNYEAVVWNNISGDALTIPQQQVFKNYLEQGGGYVGVHGSGGDFVYPWRWYVDSVIGAQFIGHPMNPQFQTATVKVSPSDSGITDGLPEQWSMTEEWYSFATSPRVKGARILAALDEATYNPPAELKMGADHPIAWIQCIDDGRSFYTAIGHRPESYTEPHSVQLLEQGMAWAAGAGKTICQRGQEVSRQLRH